MGFGIIFFGYLLMFLMSFNVYGFAFRLLGCIVIMHGLRGVKQYEPRYLRAEIFIGVAAAFAMAEALSTVLGEYLGIFNLDILKNASVLLFSASAVVFHFLFNNATAALAREVGAGKVLKKALRNSVFVCVQLSLLLLTAILYFLKINLVNYVFMASVIFFFLLLLFHISLIYSCYKEICPEGDEEAPAKPSRIGFLNKLWAVTEKRDNEIYEKTKAYAENRIKIDSERKKEKRENKQKHKKKKR